MTRRDDSNLVTFTVGAIVGAAAGALAALLLAPRSGEETRHQISEGAHDAKEKTAKLLEDARENARRTLQTTKISLSEKMALLTEAIDAGRKAAGEARREWGKGNHQGEDQEKKVESDKN